MCLLSGCQPYYLLVYSCPTKSIIPINCMSNAITQTRLYQLFQHNIHSVGSAYMFIIKPGELCSRCGRCLCKFYSC